MWKQASLRSVALATAALCLSAGLQVRDVAALTPSELRATGQDAAPPAQSAPGVLDQGLLEDLRLKRLYETRSFLPIWLDAEASGLSARGEDALLALADADSQGLDPALYQVREIETARREGRWQEVDLLISSGLLGYLGDQLRGREALRDQGAGLDGNETPVDPVEAVSRLAAAPDLAAALAALAPRHPQYERLRRTLAELRQVAAGGGWTRVPEGETLDPGMRNPRVVLLRERLAGRDPAVETPAGEAVGASSVGAAGADKSDPAHFDQALERAVRSFQQRSGLAVDGRVGPKTLAALNRTAAELVEVVQANMERWRWLPQDLGPRYLLVNTAGYDLRVVEDGEVVLRMPVVTGTPARATPMFSAEMSYLEVNPTWTVPPTIFAEDYLPELREDPGYLARQRITLYASWSESAVPIDPYSIDWHAVRASPRSLPYRLVQSPGPHNALGRIKFMMPNRHTIYLHDTNHPELFSRSRRALSSGCVRLARPDDLAKLVLKDAEGWDMERLQALYASGESDRISLQRSWPVHMVYFTVWVDGDGTTHFYDDVYGRDRALVEQLRSSEVLLAEEPLGRTGRS